MYTLDKEAFGRFVAQLRKEQGMTQKMLAQTLQVTDKAVSKWETGQRCPDIALLIPLARALGVTVTELLECRRVEQPLPVEQVDAVVQATLAFPDGRGWKRAARVAVCCGLILCLLSASFFSYVKFRTPNFVTAGVGVLRVMLLEDQMVEISRRPRVVLASPEGGYARFLEQLEAEGYDWVEQMGRMYFMEKNGQRYSAEFSVNGWFARWIFE